MDVDYAAIYKDVNQVSRPVPTRQCSPVMAIQRMYIRLDDLDVRLLRNPEVVKQLYVFADVVELEGDSVELPGSSQVTVVCRVLRINRSDGVAIRLSGLNPVNCRGGESRRRPENVVDHHWVSPNRGELSDDGRLVTILATHLVAPAQAQGLRVQCPIAVQARVYDTDGYHPESFSSDGTVEWQVSPYSDKVAATRSATARVSFAPFARISWRVTEAEWYPSFRVALPEPIPPQLLDNSNIVLGVEATTLISELVMEYQREATNTVAATLQHVTWLNDQLIVSAGAGTAPSDQSAFRFAHEQQIRAQHFRVQALLKLPHRHDEDALIVPPLQYERYDRLIDLMTRAAESYDNAFRQLNLQMQQTEVLGSFLLQQNKAFAAKERNMEIHHSQLVSLQEADLEAANEKIKRLNSDLAEQNRAMEEAKADMDKGIKQFRDRLIAEAVFAVLAAIVQVCLAIFTGGATAAGAVATAGQLSETAKALQSVVRLLERLEQIVKIIHAVTDFLSTLQTLDQIIGLPEMPELPTEADWDIFENEIVAVAEGMPTDISEVPVWKAKCKNVAALGREIIRSVAFMQQLQYSLGVNKMLQNVAQRQAERLESLQIQGLDNYLEMATELDMRTNRMLMALLKVLSLQTGALSYHYLLQPRRVNGWVRMNSVWNALVRNAYDAVDALGSLGSAPTDLVVPYVVKDIPVGLLLRGDDFFFDIPVDGPAVSSAWFRVRIEYVELKFPAASAANGLHVHLPTTSSGEVYILLQAARLFDDRLKDHQVLHFQAASPLRFQYAYHLESGQTTVSNRPTHSSSRHYFRMTPFTRWRLRLSASAFQNQGLTFPTVPLPQLRMPPQKSPSLFTSLPYTES